jgi:membrane protease YdiL (CAAX protease family)
MAGSRSPKKNWLQEHSLSIVSVLLLVVWIVAYRLSDPATHLGAFFGNAIADWSGSVVIILGTKFLYEVGSAESHPIKNRKANPLLELIYEHSLLIFLGVTGIGWVVLYLRMGAEEKWGQVVGNIVSEWLQMAGLVFLTKRLIERGSKESR